MTKKGRKLILVRKDLLEEAAKITAKEGKTMFAFTNEVFDNALKAHNMETNLAEVLESYALLRLGKNIGLTALPSVLLEYMLKELYKSDKINLIDEAYKSGLWFGKCMSVKFPEDDVIQTFNDIIKKYMWHSLDLSVNQKDESVELRCLSPTMSKENTEVIYGFIKGAFESFEYKLVKNTCSRGIIQMKFKQIQG
ncbi:MAG: hypothetical protein PVF96_02480 [Candidatus Bathyarchaeota archaeon]|jgi:hypothetical protein